MKRIGGILLATCMCLLIGCGQPLETIKQENVEIKIGLSFDSFVVERWYREQDAFISKAEELGAEVYVQNANGEVGRQEEQIEYLIAEKVDVIVLVATDADALTPLVKKAKNQGIKVIAYDRLVKNADVDLYISFDNEKIGELLAETVTEQVPNNGNIIMICGSPTDNNVTIIEDAIFKVLNKTKIKVLHKAYAENWLREVAFDEVSHWVEQYGAIDGIICGNDDLAGEAVKALAEYRLAGEVCVVGQDADLAACQRIVEGTQAMTIFKDVTKLAKEAAELAVTLAKNEPVQTKQTINDGSYDIPYRALTPIKVTKENMDEVIIDGGFHLKEDVYLNMMDKE